MLVPNLVSPFLNKSKKNMFFDLFTVLNLHHADQPVGSEEGRCPKLVSHAKETVGV